MRRVFACLGLAVTCAALTACNAVLGINEATLESDAGQDGSSSGASDAGADGPERLDCAHYCDVIMANCAGPFQEYLTRDICISMCPVFELGTITDSLQDTLGCRLWHAHAAAEAPDIHCPHAGPLGGDHCGDACQAFCNLDTAYCAGPISAYDGGFRGCLGACPAFTYSVGPDAGDLTEESGDSLNCRLWHLESAYASAAASTIHCPHTAVDSTMCR
jgi:hypothetical protein